MVVQRGRVALRHMRRELLLRICRAGGVRRHVRSTQRCGVHWPCQGVLTADLATAAASTASAGPAGDRQGVPGGLCPDGRRRRRRAQHDGRGLLQAGAQRRHPRQRGQRGGRLCFPGADHRAGRWGVFDSPRGPHRERSLLQHGRLGVPLQPCWRSYGDRLVPPVHGRPTQHKPRFEPRPTSESLVWLQQQLCLGLWMRLRLLPDDVCAGRQYEPRIIQPELRFPLALTTSISSSRGSQHVPGLPLLRQQQHIQPLCWREHAVACQPRGLLTRRCPDSPDAAEPATATRHDLRRRPQCRCLQCMAAAMLCVR